MELGVEKGMHSMEFWWAWRFFDFEPQQISTLMELYLHYNGAAGSSRRIFSWSLLALLFFSYIGFPFFAVDSNSDTPLLGKITL
jgi:hypothetical protein